MGLNDAMTICAQCDAKGPVTMRRLPGGKIELLCYMCAEADNPYNSPEFETLENGDVIRRRVAA